jgi:hypothetical protein
MYINSNSTRGWYFCKTTSNNRVTSIDQAFPVGIFSFSTLCRQRTTLVLSAIGPWDTEISAAEVEFQRKALKKKQLSAHSVKVSLDKWCADSTGGNRNTVLKFSALCDSDLYCTLLH